MTDRQRKRESERFREGRASNESNIKRSIDSREQEYSSGDVVVVVAIVCLYLGLDVAFVWVPIYYYTALLFGLNFSQFCFSFNEM